MSLTRFLDGQTILILASVDGLVEYVDYIPVEADTDGALKRFDNDGVYQPGSVIDDGTGLVAWVDYTPVFVVDRTVRWSSDANGFQPVNDVTP